MLSATNRSTLVFAGLAMTSLAASAVPFSSFDDGTTQGWTAYGGSILPPVDPFGGTLQVVSNGNPGKAMAAFDNVSGGGDLWVSAPTHFLGDLSAFSRITWDELLPINANDVTRIILVNWSANSGLVMENIPSIVAGWRQRSIDLAPGSWTIVGNALFSEIIGSVQGFYMNLEVSNGLAIEATVDNIGLSPVPELDPRMMLAAGLFAISLQFRPRQKQHRWQTGGFSPKARC